MLMLSRPLSFQRELAPIKMMADVHTGLCLTAEGQVGIRQTILQKTGLSHLAHRSIPYLVTRVVARARNLTRGSSALVLVCLPGFPNGVIFRLWIQSLQVSNTASFDCTRQAYPFTGL